MLVACSQSQLSGCLSFIDRTEGCVHLATADCSANRRLCLIPTTAMLMGMHMDREPRVDVRVQRAEWVCGYDHHVLQCCESVLSVAEAATIGDVLLLQSATLGVTCIFWHAYSLSVSFVLSVSMGWIGYAQLAPPMWVLIRCSSMFQAHAQCAGSNNTNSGRL
jgi:hypothetical protein